MNKSVKGKRRRRKGKVIGGAKSNIQTKSFGEGGENATNQARFGNPVL